MYLIGWLSKTNSRAQLYHLKQNVHILDCIVINNIFHDIWKSPQKCLINVWVRDAWYVYRDNSSAWYWDIHITGLLSVSVKLQPINKLKKKDKLI